MIHGIRQRVHWTHDELPGKQFSTEEELIAALLNHRYSRVKGIFLNGDRKKITPGEFPHLSDFCEALYAFSVTTREDLEMICRLMDDCQYESPSDYVHDADLEPGTWVYVDFLDRWVHVNRLLRELTQTITAMDEQSQ